MFTPGSNRCETDADYTCTTWHAQCKVTSQLLCTAASIATCTYCTACKCSFGTSLDVQASSPCLSSGGATPISSVANCSLPTNPSPHLPATSIFPQNRLSVSHIDEDVPQCQSGIRIVRLNMHAWQ